MMTWTMRLATPLRAALTVAAGVGATLAVAEAVTWRASHSFVPRARRDATVHEPGEAVLVLGFASRGHGRVGAVQHWRIRIAVRSVDPADALFVFTGAATRGGLSEAAVMADHAECRFGVPRAHIVLEEQATTTWENIGFSIPLLADATSIRIASNTFHARRARRYLAKRSPELAERLRRGRDYLPLEFAPLKPVLAGYELVRILRELLRRLRISQL
jgi:hypothetical protein